MQINTTTLENNLTLSGKVLFTLGPAIQFLVIYSGEFLHMTTKSSVKEALFTTAPKWKQLEYPISGECTNTLGYQHTTGYQTWMNYDNIHQPEWILQV